MVNTMRAVVVGINEYKEDYQKMARLNYARADAEEIARVLSKSTAFQMEKPPVLLTDGRATIGAVRDSFYEVFSSRSSDNNSIALFYFAGHGLHNPKDDRISLCCHDVNFADPNQGGLRLNDIYDLLSRSSAECNIAIIDACFSGGIIDPSHIAYITAAEHARKAIEALRGPDGKTIAIFAACRTDEGSRESKSRKHGIYTDTLLKGWRDGEACGNDGMVSLFGLTDFLARSFAEDRQVPQFAIRGGKTIALWQGTPHTRDMSLPPPESTQPLEQSAPGSIIFTPGVIKVPTHKPKTPSRWLRPAIIGTVVALAACTLITAVTPQGQGLFFGLAFGASALLALLILWPSRGWALPVTLAQFALLAGFGYTHFGWGRGLTPLRWLAGWETLFWVFLLGEIVLFTIIGLLKIMKSG